MPKVSTVSLQSDAYMHPQCNCFDYCSMLIPCRGICAVLHGLSDNIPMHIKNLNPRWHLRGHPLYANALRSLGIDTGSVAAGNSPEIISNNFNMELLSKVRVPIRQHSKYNSLHEIAKEICEKGSRGKS